MDKINHKQVQFSGPFEKNILASIYLKKEKIENEAGIKDIITLRLPTIKIDADKPMECFIQLVEPLSEEFRPKYETTFPAYVINNGNADLGSILIKPDGTLIISASIKGDKFSYGKNAYGIYNIEISY